MDRVLTLKSRSGSLHTYEITPHPASEGLPLAMKLASLSLPGLLSLLGGLMESEEFRGMAAQAVAPGIGSGGVSAGTLVQGVTEVLESLEGVDLSQLSNEVRTALADEGAAQIVRDLLKHTTRTDATGNPQPLANQFVWEQAYTANYFEMLQAAWQAALVNGFFPELSTLATKAKGQPSQAPSGLPPTSGTGDSSAATT